MISRIFTQSRWRLSLALICALAAYHLQNPLLLPARAWAEPVLLLVGVMCLAATLCWRPRQPWLTLSIAILWLATIGFIVVGASAQYRHRQTILQAADRNPELMARLGAHLVVGYDNSQEIRMLAQRGLIGGIFITRHNVMGKTFEQLRVELALLQAVRRKAKLPPLIIATDQEGGPVSRLSPPLPLQPALASVLADDAHPHEIEQRARQYGAAQASALAALGINTNFSPVVDLKPAQATGFLNFHTQIADRAIASDPNTVTQVALAYSQALLRQGVMPTLKHFPGLGSVSVDTHYFNADLNTSLSDLLARDWRPFQQILSQTPALLMVGHVTVSALDKTRPASVSPAVLTGLVRQQWQFDGAMISDDLSMAPIYKRGLCRSSVESLNAGMDLLLISYDWKKYYLILDCLQHAEKTGALAPLEKSHQRLQALPWNRPVRPLASKHKYHAPILFKLVSRPIDRDDVIRLQS